MPRFSGWSIQHKQFCCFFSFNGKMTKIKQFKNGKYLIWVDFWNEQWTSVALMLLKGLNPEGSIGFAHFSRFNREALTVCRFFIVFGNSWRQILCGCFTCSSVVPETQNPFWPPSLNSTLALVEMIGFAIKGGRKPPLTTNQSRSPLRNLTSQIEHILKSTWICFVYPSGGDHRNEQRGP